jgi:hypothetical protein
MKKATILFGLLLLFILVGCNGGKSLLFTGQSKHWKGDYTANINENTEDGVFTIRFKNGGNPTFKNLEVDVQGGNSHPIIKEDIHKGSTIKLKSSGSGIATTKDNTIFKVTIKWNNKYKETFSLKPRKYN